MIRHKRARFLKMITAKKLIKLARKWQKLAAIRRRRLTLPQTISSLDSDDCGSSSAAEKGHFVVYTTDKKRFVLPLNYLNNEILRELFNLAEEEFGLTSDGPITLPCDATFMEYAITLIQQNVAKDIEKALLITIASSRCPSSLYLHHDVRYHRLSICTRLCYALKISQSTADYFVSNNGKAESEGTKVADGHSFREEDISL
uniref:Auxin-responsive protein n=1 Tax=Salix viminalis TaxID=40686 RepID=A0A6N2LMV8_SALVM